MVSCARGRARTHAAADASRALEVFSRRAVDFAFVYPKDLLPEDPLAKALATGFNSPCVSTPGPGFAATFIGSDAIGVRIRSIPITPDKVIAALQAERAGGTL